MNYKKPQVNLFIYPTYLCQGHCRFCFINPKLKKASNDMGLKEIFKNIDFFYQKYLISNLVLVGGEPLIYKKFISLMDNLGNNYFWNGKLKVLTLATEALLCSSDNLANYLKKFFDPKLNFYSSLQISLNNFNSQDKFFEQRKKAILNLAKRRFRIRFIFVINKNNFKKFKFSLRFINKLFNSFYPQACFNEFGIELRIPYLSPQVKNIKNDILISKELLPFINQTIKIFLSQKIPFALRNIPLCYLLQDNLKKLESYEKVASDMKVIRIDKNYQFEKAIISDYSRQLWSIHDICKNCSLKKRCNGIDKKYLKNFNYPNLKPII